MYKDSKGRTIYTGDVVVTERGYIYNVSGFNSEMNCSVQLAHGCVRSQCPPEDLTCIEHISDLEGWFAKG